MESGQITNECFQLDDVSVEWRPFKSLLFAMANSGSAIVDQGWWADWWVLGGDNAQASNSYLYGWNLENRPIHSFCA